MKMNIEDKIKEIAQNNFQQCSYVFDDWYSATEVVDRVEFPVIMSILPNGGRLDFSRGILKDSENLMIAFIDKVERDANGEDNKEVYTRMKETASQFINAMNKSNFFEPIENVKYNTILERATSYFTGVVIEFSVKQRTGICL